MTTGKAAGQSVLTFTDPVKETVVQLLLSEDRWTGTQRGQAPLWDRINEIYAHWIALGRPSQQAYRVDWERHRHLFRLLLEEDPICDL